MAAIKSTLALHGNSTTIPFGLNFSRTSSASRVNALGLVETIAAGNIRLDYNPSVSGELYGWLLEETSTNSFLQSQNFAQTWSTAGDGDIQSDTDKAPDGVVTSADTLKSGSGGTVRVAVVQAGLTFVSGTKYTVSVWAKKKELDYLEISDKLDATSVTYAKTFKISDGTLGVSDGAVVDATIKAYPNDWYRCSVTFTASDGMATVFLKARSDNDASTTSTVSIDHGICLWGAQVEEKEYATSYIPTTTGTTTRAADVAYIQEENPSWNWDIGTTLFINATPLYTGGTNKPIYHYQDSTNKNFVTLLNTGNVKIFSDVNGTSTNQLDADPFTTGFSMSDRIQFKNMISLKKDSAHMAQNGALSTTLAGDTNIIVPLNSSSHTYTIKFFHGQGLTSSSGWLKDFLIWSNIVADDILKSDTLVGSGLGTTNADLYNQISDLSVTEAKIVAGAVTTDKIADNAITTAKIAFEVIVADDLDANAITVSKIQDGAVATDKIADNAVTGAKIAMGSDAAGDVLYYSGTDYVKLAKGNNGEVLTLASGLPSWAPDSTDVAGTTIGGVSGDLSGTIATATINNGAITNAKLGANAVDGDKLADDAVDSEHYTNLSIDTAHIGNLQVTDGKIAATTITGAKIAATTIESGNLVNGAVTNTKLGTDSVDGTKLADNAVDSEHYTDLSIDTAHIADLQVTNGKLASNAVTTIKITDLNVTEVKIANGAVTNAKLGADAVNGDKLTDNAVDSEHYVDGSIDTAHIADLQVTNGKIANATITGAKIAATTIESSNIANNAVTNSKILNNAVTTNKVADNQITIGKLAVTDGTSGQVLSTNGAGVLSFIDDTDTTIGDAAVGGDVTGTISNIQIAANAVGETEIANGAVTNDKLAANSITSDKILLDVIVAEDLAANSVTFSELQDGAVRTAKIQANAVDGTKIAMTSDARGDILYYNGTDYARLEKGTSGHVLTMGANDPAWGSAPVSQSDIGAYPVGGDVTGSVSSITIPANTITSAMIAPGVIVAQDIATNAVNGTHIAIGSDAAGDVMYYNGTDYVRLAKGTAGQVLKINAGATAPEWAADIDTDIGDAAVGGMVSGTLANISIAAGVVTPTMLSASGTASSSTFLRGDGQWATPVTVETDPTAVTMAIALG